MNSLLIILQRNILDFLPKINLFFSRSVLLKLWAILLLLLWLTFGIYSTVNTVVDTNGRKKKKKMFFLNYNSCSSILDSIGQELYSDYRCTIESAQIQTNNENQFRIIYSISFLKNYRLKRKREGEREKRALFLCFFFFLFF